MQKSLKYVLLKNKESVELIESMADALQVDFAVENSTGKILRVSKSSVLGFKKPIAVHLVELGWFHYQEERALSILKLIQHLIEKENEKRKIGSEVLNLYREINMIYNFSEQLSEKIDARSIAMTALKEAGQIIKNSFGSILLYDEQGRPQQAEISPSNENGEDERRLNWLQSFPFQTTAEIVPRAQLNGALSALIYAPFKVKNKVLGTLVLAHHEAYEYKAAELKLLTTISLQAATAMETANLFDRNIREVEAREEAVRKIFKVTQRFVPHEFIRSLGKSDITQVNLGDAVEKEVTVMFADIRDYTSLSEEMTLEDNFRFVNAFNQRMGPVIQKHQGFVNQYLGDGMMAIFPENAEGTLRAAVEMQIVLRKYNEERKLENRVPIRMGIGLHEGPLIMGIIGDDERMDAATISDTVNAASRIEGLTKHFGANILISEAVIKKLENQTDFNLRYLGLVKVKGKAKLMKIYECCDGDSEEQIALKKETLTEFEQGMSFYLNKMFTEAKTHFTKVREHNTKDRIAKFYLQKIDALRQKDLPANWNGVELMNEK